MKILTKRFSFMVLSIPTFKSQEIIEETFDISKFLSLHKISGLVAVFAYRIAKPRRLASVWAIPIINSIPPLKENNNQVAKKKITALAKLKFQFQQ